MYYQENFKNKKDKDKDKLSDNDLLSVNKNMTVRLLWLNILFGIIGCRIPYVRMETLAHASGYFTKIFYK